MTVCARCETDAGPFVTAIDDKTYCTECVVTCSVCNEPVVIEDAIECAGFGVYPEFHCGDHWTDCGACRDDAARERAFEMARDLRYG